jgi:hypothetical protein
MDSTKRIALLFILLPILGGVFSCLFFSARMRGTFTKWESLGRPIKTPNKLIRMNYVETVSGDIYEFQYAETCTSNCWVKVDSLPPRFDEMELLPLDACDRAFDIPSVNHFSNSVIECWRWGTGIRLDVQAIDRDGNIQMWSKGQDDFGSGLLVLMSPIIGVVLGFITAIIVLIVLLFRDSVVSLVSRS